MLNRFVLDLNEQCVNKPIGDKSIKGLVCFVDTMNKSISMLVMV